MGVFSNNSTAATEGGYIHTILFDDEVKSNNKVGDKVRKDISDYDKGFKDGYRKAKVEILEKISKALGLSFEEEPKYIRDPKIDNYIKEELKSITNSISSYDTIIENKTLNARAALTFNYEDELIMHVKPLDESIIRTNVDLSASYRTLHTLYIDEYLNSKGIYITDVSQVIENDVYRKVIIYKVSRDKPDKLFNVRYDLDLKNVTGEVRKQRS